MITYYLELAVRSLWRNAALTALTVVAVAVGIGASMSVYTVFRAVSADPIPQKSSQLFAVLIDNWGPNATIPENAQVALSYPDAMALMRAQRAARQAGMSGLNTTVTPADPAAVPIAAKGLATYTDFFRMFDVPFRSGRPWSSAEDESRADVVVVSAKFADRLFPGANAVGQELIIDRQPWRIIGVLKPWDPRPHFYDLFLSDEDIFIPFQSALAHEFTNIYYSACNTPPPATGVAGRIASECQWISFWVELPTAATVQSYRQFLQGYAAEQKRIGRFHWPPRYHLYSVREWLTRLKVVPDEVRLATFMAFGFLAVCLLNAISLLLAKFTGRVGSLSVHRALGASRGDVFIQCLIESALVGAGGGILGLGLTLFGLKVERLILTEALADLTHLDGTMVAITVSVAIVATVACGTYPSWRASRVQPAGHLKAQ